MFKHMCKKISQTSKCAKGEHTFVVSGWDKYAKKDVVNGFTCQHCLLHLGINDVETMRDCHNEELRNK